MPNSKKLTSAVLPLYFSPIHFIQNNLQLSQDTVEQMRVRWPCLRTQQQQLIAAVICSLNLKLLYRATANVTVSGLVLCFSFGRHTGAAVSAGTSQLEGPGFNPLVGGGVFL